MKRFLMALVIPMAFAAAGCTSWFRLDGYEASYVDTSAEYERGAHWKFHNDTVYEVDGKYYRKHENRWVVYRERPRELVREEKHEERHEEHRLP